MIIWVIMPFHFFSVIQTGAHTWVPCFISRLTTKRSQARADGYQTSKQHKQLSSELAKMSTSVKRKLFENNSHNIDLKSAKLLINNHQEWSTEDVAKFLQQNHLEDVVEAFKGGYFLRLSVSRPHLLAASLTTHHVGSLGLHLCGVRCLNVCV